MFKKSNRVNPQPNTSAGPQVKVLSPFNISLHEVLMPPNLEMPPKLKSATPKLKVGPTQSKAKHGVSQSQAKSKGIANQTKFKGGPPKVVATRQKSQPKKRKKRRRSRTKQLKAAEYVELSLQQIEREAAEKLEKFEAAKARVERRHTYGAHVQEKFIHMMHEKKRLSQDSQPTSDSQKDTPSTHPKRVSITQVLAEIPRKPDHHERFLEMKEIHSAKVKKLSLSDKHKEIAELKPKQPSRMIMIDDVWVKDDESEDSLPRKERRKKPDNSEHPNKIPVKSATATSLQPTKLGSFIASQPSLSNIGHTVISIPEPDSQQMKPNATKPLQPTININKPKLEVKSRESRILKPRTPSLPNLLKDSKSKPPLMRGPLPESTFKQHAYDKATELMEKGSIVVLRPPQKTKAALQKPTDDSSAKQSTPTTVPPLKSKDSLLPKTPSGSKLVVSSGESALERKPSKKESYWKRLSPSRIQSAKSRVRLQFDPRKEWRHAIMGVMQRLKLERLEREAAEHDSSSSEDDLDDSDLPRGGTTAPAKKRGCFGKIMNFFKESDDSDQKRETVLERRRHNLKIEREELSKMRKHKRKIRRKAKEKLSKKKAKVTLENSMQTVYSKVVAQRRLLVDNHHIGLAAMAQAKHEYADQGDRHHPSVDPLTMSNIKHVSTYREFAKNAHGALPSRMADTQDNPTANLFASIVPILKQKNVTTADETTADTAIQKFRDANKDGRRPSGFATTVGDLPEDPLISNKTDLRAIPANISQKRGVKLERDLANRRKARFSLGVNHRFKNCCGGCVVKFRRIYRDLRRFTNIWQISINKIDEHFGVGPSTYFRWLRSVVMLNILYVTVSYSFLLLPELRHASAPSSKNPFQFTDIFLAEGYIGTSAMFYGTYEFYDDRMTHFRNTGFRFVFVMLVIFMFNSIFIGTRIRRYYLNSIARITERDHEGQVDLFAKVLCSWDFNIINKESAQSQHRSIAREFTEEVEAKDKSRKKVAPEHDISAKWLGSHGGLIIHWTFNLVLLAIVCVFGYLMYFLLERRLVNLQRSGKLSCNQHFNSLLDVASACIFSFVTAIFTPCCIWATNAESWESVTKRTNYLMARIALIYIAMISVFYVFWLDSSVVTLAGDTCCWENEFGNELYRIIIFESGSNLIVNTLMYKVYPAFVRKCLKREPSPLEFQMEVNQINLIFLHTLSGIGVFYSPALPSVILIRLVTTFYWQKYLLFTSCCFPQHQLHQKDIYSPYLAAFFISYLMVTIMNTWTIAEVHPSHSCGPFRNYTSFSEVFHETPSSAFIADFLEFITEAQFSYFCLFFTAGVVFTLRAWGNAYFDRMNLLHTLLQLERLDRDFLLKAMFNIAKMNEIKSEVGLVPNDLQEHLLDVQIQEAAQPILATRRRALPEVELRVGIMDFMAKQARLDELLADDPEDVRHGEAVHHIEDDRRPSIYPLAMTLSPKAIRRLRNRRLSIPAAIFVETAEANKLSYKKRNMQL